MWCVMYDRFIKARVSVTQVEIPFSIHSVLTNLLYKNIPGDRMMSCDDGQVWFLKVFKPPKHTPI